MNVRNNNESGVNLATNTLDNIPTPTSNAKDIVALVKENGHVNGYKLSDGSVLNKDEAIQLAKSGGINGVGVAHRRDTEYLKSLPDNKEDNNLSNLPTISASSVFHQ